ncbi:nucleoside-triphosphatase [Melioribacter sp. Ez-97]|uniref:nucleoside-triphosphatase n=1 Tax=Melioribacter sp. Ez-97 TaxID=3423434 RepID=UPI003EDAD452
MSNIKIISGLINTGKTTALFKWAAARSGVDGIFQPVINEKRFLYHIQSRTVYSLEPAGKEDELSVGKFRFSRNAFRRANDNLIEAVKQNYGAIVFDEIGKLELEGEGLADALNYALEFSGAAQLILVVRENLLDKVADKFKIVDPEIIREPYEII